METPGFKVLVLFKGAQGVKSKSQKCS